MFHKYKENSWRNKTGEVKLQWQRQTECRVGRAISHKLNQLQDSYWKTAYIKLYGQTAAIFSVFTSPIINLSLRYSFRIKFNQLWLWLNGKVLSLIKVRFVKAIVPLPLPFSFSAVQFLLGRVYLQCLVVCYIVLQNIVLLILAFQFFKQLYP